MNVRKLKVKEAKQKPVSLPVRFIIPVRFALLPISSAAVSVNARRNQIYITN
ncbi:MAG TPA: hypothetical protein VH280_12695 [Verrucomicrobiae bacterium]|jgi:hypothetical protein|nr:hypothetical protein [Verrucomicrobiae bacterium]